MDELSLYLRTLEERLEPERLLARVVGGACDLWQRQLLNSTAPFAMVLASRRIGKSTSVGVLAAQEIAKDNHTVLIISPTLAQSQLLMKKCLDGWRAMALPIQATRSTLTMIELENGSSLTCVPAGADGESARGYGIRNGLLIYEEGAFIPDAVYDATLPIREDNARILIITTPGIRGGAAYRFWTEGDIEKITARSMDQPRMAAKVAFDKKHMPPLKFEVEHGLRWMGQGSPYFHYETIREAYSDVPALRLGDIYA